MHSNFELEYLLLSADLVACEAEEVIISLKLFASSKLCAYVYVYKILPDFHPMIQGNWLEQDPTIKNTPTGEHREIISIITA